MTFEPLLTRREALARMRLGDLPTRGGGYSSALYFSDGRRTSGPVGYRLRKDGLIEPPAGSACDGRYTLVAPRYVVRTETSQVSTLRTPHQVVDTRTASVVDEYASKRAAGMHARELNQIERATRAC